MRAIVFSLISLLIFPAAADPAAGRERCAMEQSERDANLLQADRWQPFEAGYETEPDGSFRCGNAESMTRSGGARQTLILNQTRPRPILLSGWSRSEQVGGSADGDYALYCDVTFADGTAQWGKAAPFPVGDSAWNRQSLTLVYGQPVAQLEVYALFRKHSGTAWFRDFRAFECPEQGALFDTVPIRVTSRKAAGFLLRDAGRDGDFSAFDADGKAAGLELNWSSVGTAGATRITATLHNPEATDRAVTLYYTVPLPEGDIEFLNGLAPGERQPLDGNHDYLAAAEFPVGNGANALEPFAAVTAGSRGIALGFAADRPAYGRVGGNGATRELFLAFDLALTPEVPSTTVELVTFDFEATRGKRGAWQRYYELFPEAFLRRVPKQGSWMAFESISRIEHWEDFGFAFKEGTNESAWDRAHGILTFRYSEPMTWWMDMAAAPPRDLAEAIVRLQQAAADGNPEAQAIVNSGMYDASGTLSGRRENMPWCDGVVWSANSMPHLTAQPSSFSLRWNPDLFRRYHSDEAGPERVAGEYIDSAEGYVTLPFSFRREHFAAAQTPLTFDRSSFRPGIFRGLVAYEYIRAIAADLRAANAYVMANATPNNLWFLAPQLDVMGTEINWFEHGRWTPTSMAALRRIRALCAQKPFCLLMNTDFTTMPPEQLEKYFQRAVSLGMFPGFFSTDASSNHYFSQPALYNRDRWLFRKYLPAAIAIAEAGWQPITLAAADRSEVCVERFGTRYLTVYHSGTAKTTAAVTLDPAWPGDANAVVDRLTGRRFVPVNRTLTFELEPDQLLILDFNPPEH